MKNNTRMFLSLAMLAATGAAHADNSVTLYGIVDTGLTWVNNDGGHKSISMTSGNQSGNRWGLKGAEDLGGGLKTIFTLESGFDSTNGKMGQGSRLFGRQAFVGLSGDRWGTLTVGRQYDPLVDLVQPVQGDNFLGGVFISPGDIDNADNSARVNNAIKYTSPSLSGFQFSALYSLGGVAGATGSGQSYAVAAAYSNGPLNVAAGYYHFNNGNAANRGTTTWDSLFSTPVNAAYATASAINNVRFGGNYLVGPVTLGGYYSHAEYTADGRSAFANTQKYNTGSVYAVWQVSAPLQTQIGYVYMKSSGNSSAKYHQFAAAADYALSKRTDVYAWAAYTTASGTQDPSGTPAVAVIGSATGASGSGRQATVTAGIRHKF
ncbi:porin [Paraburkholderia sabiae]|uniref:Porin n=1 Tax=Paraburkholderia sabiae TaxID=273251 RepID=A0ABU9QMZ1_9BURK|nr:porin [Paraburkholderia sabiae]WJZ77310.1 porin [Paraburkholderia sabiae]CAD6547967.1 Outer membrane porin protein [Paraburkholderia sabiae]